jgi:hypothetical protein
MNKDSIFIVDLSAAVQRGSNPNVQKITVVVGGDDDDDNDSEHSHTSKTCINIDSPTSDDKNREMCSYDTIDALPHIDHYRNLFSITSPESKIRPTLEALHETSKLRLGSTIDLNSEMVSTLVPQTDLPSQVETKQKVEVVKFGWIVGVLVS